MPEWSFIAILHNLSLATAIGNDYLAIVPEDDIRAIELLRSSSPSLSRMVGNFTDQFGRRTSPSLLLEREGSPLGVSKQDAVIGFRNAVALSSITYAWQEALVRQLSLNVLKYSNYFDLYPITVGRDDVLVIRSPSIVGMDDPDDFIGQVSPELARSYRASDEYDEELFGAIMSLWADRFVAGRMSSWRTRVLFRSLEMAYHASTIPFENDSTIYDYGAKIALWVSAFEVLVRSETEHANLEKVLALLREARVYWPKLRHRRYTIGPCSKVT